jgi:hypothetical protein
LSRAPRQRSRADHEFFDFNDPLHTRAANRVTPEQLTHLFEQLDRADERFPADARAATLSALKAVAEFLTASPLNGNGRFSRPFELLITELRKRPRSEVERILPTTGGGSGGINARESDLHAKAAAAYTVEFLHAITGASIDRAAAETAAELTARRFRFAGQRSDKALTVKSWRRDFTRDNIRNKDGSIREPSPAALVYRGYLANSPVAPTGDKRKDRAAILAWLVTLVGRAGYGKNA